MDAFTRMRAYAIIHQLDYNKEIPLKKCIDEITHWQNFYEANRDLGNPLLLEITKITINYYKWQIRTYGSAV